MNQMNKWFQIIMNFLKGLHLHNVKQVDIIVVQVYGKEFFQK